MTPELSRFSPLRPILWRVARGLLLVLTALTTTWVVAMVAFQATQRASETVDPSCVAPVGGRAYAYSFTASPPIWGLVIRTDTILTPQVSTATLTENGRPIGPPHSVHADINTRGGGRFSHWGATVVIFSASDGSDPRTNGRTYVFQYGYEAPLHAVLAALALIAASAGAIGLVRPGAVQVRGRWRARDWVVLVGFAALAGVVQWNALASHGSPPVLWSGDAGNVSNFVAGWVYPERFRADFLLSDPQNFAFYMTLNMAYVALANAITGDIGLSYLLLLFPLTFLQLSGFYALGYLIFANRFWAVILALVTFTPVWVWGGQELWGIYHLPLTRTSFEAALPFLFLAFLHFGSVPRRLPWLFGLCGITVYLHPVSAPAVAIGLGLASFALVESRSALLPHIRWVALSVLAFAAAAAPFAVVFFAGFPGLEPLGPAGDIQREAAAVFETRNGPQYYNAMLAVRQFLDGTGRAYATVWLSGLTAYLVVPLANPKRVRLCLFFVLFLVGVLFASVGAAFIDQTASAALGRTPAQLDLIRNIRFIVPILLIGVVLALHEACRLCSPLPVLAAPIPVAAARSWPGGGTAGRTALRKPWASVRSRASTRNPTPTRRGSSPTSRRCRWESSCRSATPRLPLPSGTRPCSRSPISAMT